MKVPIITPFALGVNGNAITVSQAHPAIATLKHEFHGVMGMITHGFISVPFWLAVAGVQSI